MGQILKKKKDAQWGKKNSEVFFSKKFVKMGMVFFLFEKKNAKMLKKRVAQWGKNFSEVFFTKNV